MTKRWYFSILLCGWMLVSGAQNPEFAIIDTANSSLRVPIKSWKTLRDQGIVKQDFDYSCGAASIATLLNKFYGQNVTEQQILDNINATKRRVNFNTLTSILTAIKTPHSDKPSIHKLLLQVIQPVESLLEYSFDDMAKVLRQMGFKAYGIAMSWEQLTKLKVPVIVYIKFRKNDHFSVIRGINHQTVWLADPSLGNRTYSKQQFLSNWKTRNNTALNGKALIILPDTQQSTLITQFNVRSNYFSKNPVRQTQSAINIMKNLRTPVK